MQWVDEKDPRLVHVSQGVQQLSDGRTFRQGKLKDGSYVFVRYEASTEFVYVPGQMDKLTDYFEERVRATGEVVRRL